MAEGFDPEQIPGWLETKFEWIGELLRTLALMPCAPVMIVAGLIGRLVQCCQDWASERRCQRFPQGYSMNISTHGMAYRLSRVREWLYRRLSCDWDEHDYEVYRCIDRGGAEWYVEVCLRCGDAWVHEPIPGPAQTGNGLWRIPDWVVAEYDMAEVLEEIT